VRRRKRKRWWKKEEVRGGERWAAGSFSARRSPSLSASCPFLSLDKSKNLMLLSLSLSNVTAQSAAQRHGGRRKHNESSKALIIL